MSPLVASLLFFLLHISGPLTIIHSSLAVCAVRSHRHTRCRCRVVGFRYHDPCVVGVLFSHVPLIFVALDKQG